MAEPVRAASTVTVAASPDAVWSMLVDIGSWSSWYPDLRKVECAGPPGPGSRFSFKSGPVSIDGTVDQWEPGLAFGFTGTSKGADAVYRFSFAPGPDGTEVAATQEMTGLAVRTMRPMLQKIADTSLAAWLAALKAAVETSA